MSSTDNNIAAIPLAFEPLSMRELAAVLVKHYGIHEGRFDLAIEFQIGVGGVGPDPENRLPGAMIGVHKVGLMPSKADGPTTVDAAEVNPAKKKAPK